MPQKQKSAFETQQSADRPRKSRQKEEVAKKKVAVTFADVTAAPPAGLVQGAPAPRVETRPFEMDLPLLQHGSGLLRNLLAIPVQSSAPHSSKAPVSGLWSSNIAKELEAKSSQESRKKSAFQPSTHTSSTAGNFPNKPAANPAAATKQATIPLPEATGGHLGSSSSQAWTALFPPSTPSARDSSGTTSKEAKEIARQRKLAEKEQQKEQQRLEKTEKQRELGFVRAKHKEDLQREREEHRRQKEQQKEQQKLALAAKPKYPIDDRLLMIEEGTFAGHPHTVLRPPGGAATACAAVGEELEEVALAILDFLALFGSALMGLSVLRNIPELLCMISSDGLAAEEEELFFRLMLAAVHGRPRRVDEVPSKRANQPDVRPTDCCKDDLCRVERGGMGWTSDLMWNVVLSESQDGAMSGAGAIRGPNCASNPVWTLLTPLTWPALLMALLTEPPLHWHVPTGVDAAEGNAAAGQDMSTCNRKAKDWEREQKWRDDLVRVLRSGGVKKMPRQLKMKALHLLCEEACTSAGMHAIVDARLETQAVLRKQRFEQGELDRKRKIQLQSSLYEKRLKIKGGAAKKLSGEHGEGQANGEDTTMQETAENHEGMLDQEAFGEEKEQEERARVAEEVEREQAEVHGLEQARLERDEEFLRVVDETRVRIEPLGQDRHGREYFILPGSPCQIITMEGVEGRQKRVAYRTVAEVEALYKWLSDKSITELPLRRALSQHIPAILRGIKEDEEHTAAHNTAHSTTKITPPPSHENGDTETEEDIGEDSEIVAPLRSARIGRGVPKVWDEGAGQHADGRKKSATVPPAVAAVDTCLVFETWGDGGQGGAPYDGLVYRGNGTKNVVPFVQYVRQLTPRFSVCLGMTWDKDALQVPFRNPLYHLMYHNLMYHNLMYHNLHLCRRVS